MCSLNRSQLYHGMSCLLALPKHRCRPPAQGWSPPAASAIAAAPASQTRLPRLSSDPAVASPEQIALAQGPVGKRWQGVSRWIVFTDLHVSPRTLDICLKVLRTVKEAAKEQDAGIAFLGERLGRYCTSSWQSRLALRQ